MPERKPNVLLVVIDACRYDYLRGEKAETPSSETPNDEIPGSETPIATQHVGLDPGEYAVGQQSAVGGGRRSASCRAGDATDLLFFGSYGWFPNEDAITTFAESAWPRIRSERPAARRAGVRAGRGGRGTGGESGVIESSRLVGGNQAIS